MCPQKYLHSSANSLLNAQTRLSAQRSSPEHGTPSVRCYAGEHRSPGTSLALLWMLIVEGPSTAQHLGDANAPFLGSANTDSIGNCDVLENNVFEMSMLCMVEAARTDSAKSKCYIWTD